MKYEKQLKAKELRAQGKSVNYIAKELGVSKSSVSLWTQDITLTTEQLETLKKSRRGGSVQASIINRERHLNKRKEYQEEGRKKAREKDFLHCMGCMLFWAEGSKNKNQITFTNSDANMMKLFVRFLTKSLGVSASDISMRVNCFLNNADEIDRVHNYWTEQLNINGCTIQKPTIKITNLPVENFGVCCINVFSTKLVQQLYGAIQEYGSFDNEMCLTNKRTRKVNH